MRTHRHLLPLAALFALLLGACTQDFPALECVSDDDCAAPLVCREFVCTADADGDAGDADDVEGDVTSDTEVDAPLDTGEDADVASDAPPDAEADTPPDVAPDTPLDTGVDADAAPDTPLDTGVDADAAPDTPADTGVDADAAPDTPLDTGADADAAPDTPLDTGVDTDTALDTTPDTPDIVEDTGETCFDGSTPLACGCPPDCRYVFALNAELMALIETWFDVTALQGTAAPEIRTETTLELVDMALVLEAAPGITEEVMLRTNVDLPPSPMTFDLVITARAETDTAGRAWLEVVFENELGTEVAVMRLISDGGAGDWELDGSTGEVSSGPAPQLQNSRGAVVRVQNNGGYRVRVWAGGALEPGTWAASGPSSSGPFRPGTSLVGLRLGATGGASASRIEVGAIAQQASEASPPDEVADFFPPQTMWPPRD